MLLFALLTFAASWLLWTSAVTIMGGDFAHPSRFAALGSTLYLLGVFAPALAALALTSYREGDGAVRSLLRRTLAWDVAPRFYLFALLFAPIARLGAAAVERIATGAWPALSAESLGIMLAATIVSTPVQAGEELGWRGFLLPRMSARFGLPLASIFVGVIWGAWHLPFFFMAGTDKSGQPFPAYVAGVTALSIAMAWLYWRTQGSLLLTMVMHAAVNNLRPIATPVMETGRPFGLHAPFVTWATVGIMWMFSGGLLIAMRGTRGELAVSALPRVERLR